MIIPKELDQSFPIDSEFKSTLFPADDERMSFTTEPIFVYRADILCKYLLSKSK